MRDEKYCLCCVSVRSMDVTQVPTERRCSGTKLHDIPFIGSFCVIKLAQPLEGVGCSERLCCAQRLATGSTLSRASGEDLGTVCVDCFGPSQRNAFFDRPI